jgi:hypothetical protein
MKKKLQIISPMLRANFPMERYHDELGFYMGQFSPETIAIIRDKFHRDGLESVFNINHGDELITGCTINKSFIMQESDKEWLPIEYHDLEIGSWLVILTFDSQEQYDKIFELGLTGLSGEITFHITDSNGKKHTIKDNFRRVNKLSDVLPFDVYVFGGETGGAGRNEHGEAHFQLKEKSAQKGRDLGKIMMPDLETWKNSDLKEKMLLIEVQSGPSLSNRDKKAFIAWLDKEDNKCLIESQNLWNESNKYNNRAVLI